MSISETTTTKRVVGFLATLALVLGLTLSSTGVAKAQTDIAALLAQIEALTAQINTLQGNLGGSTQATSFVFTRDLGQGSTGQDVLELQRFLNQNAATQVAAAGVAGGPGMETSYYGPATAAAVSKYQVAHAGAILTPVGLTAGTGYFGSSTRAHVNGQVATTPTTPTTPGTPGLSGDEADLSWNVVAETDVTVDSDGQHAFTIEIESDRRGGDASINRLDLVLDTASVRNYRAITEVSLEVDGKVIASERTDRRADWRGNDDTVRFSGLNIVVESGETVEVAVLLDLTDNATDITLEEIDYRYVDASGLVISDVEQGINATVTAENVEDLAFRFSKNRNTPSDTSLDVSSARNNETLVITDVEVRRGEFGVLEGAEVEVELTGAVNIADVKALISSFTLRLDGRNVDTISGASLAAGDFAGDILTLEFDLDEFDVEGGDTFPVEVRANFRSYEQLAGTREITNVQVVNLAFEGYDEAADKDFAYTDVSTAPSYAAIFTLSQGDVEVDVIDVQVSTPVGGGTTGDVVMKVEITNNTGGELTTPDMTHFEFGDWKGVTGIGGEAVSGAGSIADGATEEFVFTFTYTGETSDSFSVVLKEVDSVPVGYTIR